MKGANMKIQEYLEKQRVPFESHEHTPAYTAQEVAAEEHVSGYMLAKAVLIRADDEYVLCVLPASLKLDMDKIADVLKAEQVFLADETDLAKLFPDAEVGAEPPFGNLYDLSTIVDDCLAEDEEIVFQAGTHRQTIRMKFEDYKRLVEPLIADICAKF
jgi:Ala-tRNA(Pro) deacylase